MSRKNDPKRVDAAGEPQASDAAVESQSVPQAPPVRGAALSDVLAARKIDPLDLVVRTEDEEQATRVRVRSDSGSRGAHSRGPRARILRFFLYAILFVFALWYLTPIYILLVTSLKPSSAVRLDQMWTLPWPPSLDGFFAAWNALGPNFLNSLKLAIPAAIISSMLGSMNGYVLAKWKFRGADTLFTLILFGMFIPYQAILIPLTQVMSNVGLYGSIQGLILVHVIYGIPITTLIFRNYYAGIGTEVLEAGRIDGASLLGLYRYIILPLSAPCFAVVIIWQFTQAWNEFLFAVILTNQSHWPVTVALNNLAGSQLVQWNVLMAATLLAALPTLLVYIFLGRYFLRGLMAGALKG